MYFRTTFAIVVITIIATGVMVSDAFTLTSAYTAFLAPAYAALDCARAIDHPFVATMAIGASAQRVIRVFKLPEYLGVGKSQIAEAIKRGLLHPFPPYPGARSMVVTEDEVAALQEAGRAEAAAKAEAGRKRGIELNRKSREAAATKSAELPPSRKRKARAPANESVSA
jgi:hypothetical protein